MTELLEALEKLSEQVRLTNRILLALNSDETELIDLSYEAASSMLEEVTWGLDQSMVVANKETRELLFNEKEGNNA